MRDPRWRRIIIHRSLTSHSTPRIIRHDRNRARASTLYIHRHGRSLRPRTAALPATSGPRWRLRWTRRMVSPATPDYRGLDARRAVPEIPLRDPRWRRIIIHRSLTSHSTPRIIRHDRNRARASTLYIHRHGRSLRPRTAALPATSGPRWRLRWTRRMVSPATPDYRGLDARRAVPEIPLRRYKSSSRFMGASRWHGFRMSLPRERAGRG